MNTYGNNPNDPMGKPGYPVSPPHQPLSPIPPQAAISAPRPESNGIGLAGFIVSLVSWTTCGLLAPIGLILCLIGLFWHPRGFAIAGLIINLAAIGFLVFVGMWMVVGFMGMGEFIEETSRAMEEAADSFTAATEIQAIEDACTRYRIDIGSYPRELGELTVRPGEIDEAAWNGPYLSAVDLYDPWFNEYIYTLHDDGKSISVTSAGPDREADTYDDITANSYGDEWPHR